MNNLNLDAAFMSPLLPTAHTNGTSSCSSIISDVSQTSSSDQASSKFIQYYEYFLGNTINPYDSNLPLFEYTDIKEFNSEWVCWLSEDEAIHLLRAGL